MELVLCALFSGKCRAMSKGERERERERERECHAWTIEHNGDVSTPPPLDAYVEIVCLDPPNFNAQLYVSEDMLTLESEIAVLMNGWVTSAAAVTNSTLDFGKGGCLLGESSKGGS